MQSTANGTTSTGHAYTSELLFLVHVVRQENGEFKIKRMEEFVDSGLIISGFFAAELKRMEQAAGKHETDNVA